MIRLKLDKWQVCGFDGYVPFKGTSMELGQKLLGMTPWIPIDVPGGIYTALLQSGEIDDPVVERNSLKCEWVSQRWWTYETKFDAPKSKGERLRLVFEGIDYHAHIYLNNHKIAEHTGMYTPCVVDVTDRVLKRGNTLSVVFEHAPDEMGQVGYTSLTRTQKARYNYKWDFCVRMINVGLYAPVYLELDRGISLQDVFFDTSNKTDGHAAVHIKTEGAAGSVRVRLARSGKVLAAVEAAVGPNGTAVLPVEVASPELWYPNGSGAQPLYELVAEALCEDGTLSDSVEKKVAFRSIEMRQNIGAPADSLPYTFVVNGEPVYIKGVNLVPFDMEYGTVTESRYRARLTEIRDMNVNMVRIWGGGIIETPEFYSICDELGIMVWQDFIQSSSGIENEPSQIPEFLELLGKTAECATVRLRSHPSLAIWCGGNELMYAGTSRPVDETLPAVALLADICRKNCPHVHFVATTSSGPVFSFDERHPENNHDVHGPWTYLGERDQYRVYNGAKYLFHSEFGCDGLSDVSTLRRIFTPANQKYVDMDESVVWRFRGEWWNGYKRDHLLFGDALTNDLETSVDCSQFVQAEGLRYAIDHARRQNFYCSGSIIWQFCEPFPNAACTNVMDYYGNKKLAYEVVRRCYANTVASLSYDKWVWEPGETLAFSVYITGDGAKSEARLNLSVTAGGKELLKRAYSAGVGEGMTAALGGVSVAVPEADEVTVSLEIERGSEHWHSEAVFPVRRGGVCSVQVAKAYAERIRSAMRAI